MRQPDGSWELGARSQSLLELDSPSYSVFSEKFPPSQNAPESLNDVIGIARQIVQAKSSNGLPLMEDGSAADPASNGVGVLIANWTNASGGNYDQAATDQLTYLLTVAPRTSSGAISHRSDEVQLWSDFVYMVPPFLAYYGVMTDNRTLVEEAYNQIKLYRNVLIDGTGMWQHIKMGSFEDTGHWSTGNGWAAMGMLRVLASIRGSQWANALKGQTRDLENWIIEIHDAMWPQLPTALLAASTYRLSPLSGVHKHLPLAERVHTILSTEHINSDGWLNPVVDPHSFHDEGQKSAEAQAFVLKMHAAWNEWVQDGSKGANVGTRSVVGIKWWGWAMAVVASILWG
ncbi:cell wall glycoside hydrolase YteR [Ceratobasidium sp. AG-Ba]|nr:cell wall glycoside hydrolase YteR [Ceratobasidium sp. AG-Ba]